MIRDAYLQFSDAQTLTVTAASTSHVDQLAANDSVASGARIKVRVNTAFTTGDSATLVVALETDSDNGFATDLKTLISTGTLAVTDIDAIGDNILDAQVPQTALRYLRVKYTVGVGSFSAGKIDAEIVLDTNKTMDKQL